MKVHILLEIRHVFDRSDPNETLVNRFTFIRGVFKDWKDAEIEKEKMEKEALENPVPNVMLRYSVETHYMT